METARAIAAEVAAGRARAADVCAAALAAAARLNPELYAFLELTADHARAQAERIDADVAAGRPVGPLAGVPVAIKDNLCTTFGHTTCASQILRDYVSPYNATVIDRLEAAGALIVGKTNLDEFAMGSSNENSAFGPTRNPWDAQRVPGGSSGGSSAAVAARIVPLALGSDTGGSIRQPAALCGIVGLKPTYGRVSRYGLVAYGSSLDQIGPLATCVADCAALLAVIAGRDPADNTSVEEPVSDYAAALADSELESRCRGLRIGVPRASFGPGLDPQVRSAVEAALDTYRRLGAQIVDVDLPHAQYSIAAYYVVAMAECSSNLARFDGVHYGRRAEGAQSLLDVYCASRAEGFGAEVTRRVLLGTFALSAGYYDAYYDRALRVRRLIKDDFDHAFAQVDVLACPTSPTTAFRLGEKMDDPLQMYLADVYTAAVNLAGLPALSVPCGLSEDSLPIGLQLIGPAFGERGLLQVARLYERETDWHTRRPAIAA
ncbi:MAG: Asp-tRNA(Asn)/Glu-tRNA(Gln) amidotransferase subunit GatA [Phycisphaerae bacterium]|jgi:aspartyl-tRNA(Asn)/glutamyl-tRNA(Gln) amidotransferase subunit A